MTELDKFKRRLVRSVARLIHEKVPEEELWERLGTQTGTNCKVLWERMRALTIKKLRRLLAAGDRPESIAAVARLSRTDWLLYDLVLVHEDIDVIGKDVQGSGNSAEQRVMRDLFSLVQRYNLEGPREQALVENWSAATKVYNSAGHSCSPMLLQRRWYQLKESTRQVFYDLWTNYRGNQRLWTLAQETVKPSRLQAAVAKRYPAIVTQPFLSWAGMVQEGCVALPQQFEARVRNFKAKKGTDTGPELELIEPHIETIDLGADSDHDSEESTEPSQPFNFEENTMSSLTDDTEYATAANIKTEPPEVDGLSNVKILVATHVPVEQSPKHQDHTSRVTEEHVSKEIKIEACEEISETVDEESVVSNYLSNEAAELENAHIETEETDDPETDQLLQQKAYEYFKTKIKPVPDQSRDTINENVAPKLIDVIEEDEDDSDIMDNIIKLKADQFVKKVVNAEVSVATKDTEETIDQKDEDDDDIMDDIIKQKADAFVQKGDIMDDIIKQKADAFMQKGVNEEVPAIKEDPENITAVKKTMELPEISTLIDDGIEFVDDGIEYIDDDDEDSTGETGESSSVNQAKDGVEIKKEMEEGDAPSKFDLKLMMTPVVFSVRLDSITVPEGVDVNSVRDKNTMDHLISKNKPVRKKSVSQSVSELREDESTKAINESECHDNDDLFYDENRIDEVDVNEKDRVKLSSYLLQKPKNLSFNPIQLCKNPDFNTRLKRLSVTFFSSMRNRMLFKMCKPLTIDVHKAFESKIIDGTLHLKCTDVTPQPSADTVAQSEVVPSAIVPSAMPMQSLIDNTLTDVLANTVNKRVLRPNRDLVDNTIKDILPSESQYISQNHLPSVSKNSNTIQNLIDNIVEGIAPSSPSVPGPRAEPTDEPTWRNKVINLPDISRVREINQKLLTAEVPPIRIGNQVQPSTSLTQLKIIESKPKISNISGFEESTSTKMINEFARESEKVEDFLGNKPRSRPLLITVPSRAPVPWNKARGNVSWKPGDFLLTADTLVKMLDKIEGSEGGTKTKIKKTAAVKTPPAVPRNQKQAQKPQKKVALKSTTNNRIGMYCCWVKYREDKLSMKLRVAKLHRCQFGQCICCCAGKYPPPPGSWSHEEALKNACASIESVIQQSSPPMPVVRVQQGFSKQQDNATRSVTHYKGVPVNTNAMTAIQPGPDYVSHITTAPTTGAPGKIGRGRPMSVENISSKPCSKVPATLINREISALDARSAEDNDVSKDLSHTAADPSEEPILLEDSPSPPDYDLSNNMAVYSHTTKPNKLSSSTQTTHAVDFKYCTDTDSTAPDPTLAEPPVVPGISSDNINITVNQGNIVIENNNPNFPNFAKVTPKVAPPPVIPAGKNKVVCFSLPKKASVTPLHLGKNKILLTNVKFPPIIRPAPAELPQPILPNPTVVPELPTPLPAGVHLVLLPNGELTCNVEPGVQLDCEQLALLPSIVEAVKKQINVTVPGLAQQVSAPTVASDEVINLSDDEKPSNEEQEATNATVNASMTAVSDDPNSVSLGNLKEINSSEQQSVTEIVAESNIVANVEIPSRNSNVEEEGLFDVENIILEGNESKSNNRNLLSDLMEMSGISAEDTTSAPQEIVPPIVDNLNSVIQADQPISLTQESILTSEVGGLSKLSQLAQKPRLKDSLIDLSEYNTITSLAELKYACQQQGKFYKLDLVVGTMAPINVCIKKSANLKSSVLIDAEMSIVDLTIDDMASASQIQSPVLRSNRIKQGAVPVKLIKAIKPGPKRGRGRPPSLLRTKLNEAKNKHSQLLETLKIKHGHKHALKPDVHINLEDSDAPMEEEHLDESDSASQNSRRDDSGDSSDDEPLAKKVKRIRGDNISVEANISEGVEPAAVAESMEDTNTNAHTADDSNNDDHDSANDLPGAEQDQAEQSEMDIDEPVAGFIDLNPQDDNSSHEEDCILGV